MKIFRKMTAVVLSLVTALTMGLGTAPLTALAGLDDGGSFTINYDLNAGNDASVVFNVASGGGVTLDAVNSKITLSGTDFATADYVIPSPTRNYYNFAKWQYNNSGDWTDFATANTIANDSITSGGAINVKANWTPISYAINWQDKDGEAISPDGAAISYTVVTSPGSITIPACVSTYAGHTFSGWSDGSNTYAEGDTYVLNQVSPATITFRETWLANDQRTVTFKDGTTTLNLSPSTYTINDDTTITLPAAPIKAGYTFDGWAVDVDGDDAPYAGGETYTIPNNNPNLVFTAQWSVNDYTITLNGLTGMDAASKTALAGWTFDDNDNPTSATITKTVESDDFVIPAIAKTHFTFDGWSTGSGAPVTTVSVAKGSVTSNATYTANWSTVKTITLNFNTGAGAFSTADAAKFTALGGTTATITLNADDNFASIATIPSPVPADGFVFTGWTVDGSSAKVMQYGLYASEFNNQTVNLAATYAAVPNGETKVETEGSGAATIDNSTLNDIKSALDDSVADDEKAVTKVDVDEDATGVGHAADDIDDKMDDAFSGATVPVSKSYVDIDITKYTTSDTKNAEAEAVTELPKVVDIAYTPSAGVANLVAIVREHGLPPTFTLFTRVMEKPTDPVDGTYWINGNTVHIYTRYFSTYGLGYATGVYNVTFDADGGSKVDPVFTDKLGSLPTPTRSGYTFDGWYYSDGKKAAAGDVITADTALKAKWTANSSGGGTTPSASSGSTSSSSSSSSGSGTVKPKTPTPVVAPAGEDVFADNDVILESNGDGTAKLADASELSGAVVIDEITIWNGLTYKVTEIAPDAFRDSKVTKVTLGANVKKVGAGAFANCKKLKSVVIGKNVTSIGKNAFKGDTKLATITIKSTKLTKASKIGKNAFAGIKSGAVVKIKASAAVYKKTVKALKKSGLKQVKFKRI